MFFIGFMCGALVVSLGMVTFAAWTLRDKWQKTK